MAEIWKKIFRKFEPEIQELSSLKSAWKEKNLKLIP